MPMPIRKSSVIAIPPAASSEARTHFASAFGFETDCWDVHASLADGATDFVLLDVRSPAAYASGHVQGAVSMPHRQITAVTMDARWSRDTVFVVYCAGPHCNGAQRAARRLAELERPVKMMIGGVTGWVDEGFPLVTGAEGT